MIIAMPKHLVSMFISQFTWSTTLQLPIKGTGEKRDFVLSTIDLLRGPVDTLLHFVLQFIIPLDKFRLEGEHIFGTAMKESNTA